MYNYELTSLLEKVLGNSYQMKNGENAFHCPFCNHHKKKLQVNFDTQKWHCWVCNAGGHKIGILLRKINAPKQIISEVLKLLGDYKGVKSEKDEKTEYNVNSINPMTARKQVFGKARVKGKKAKQFVQEEIEKMYNTKKWCKHTTRGNWDKRNIDMYDGLVMSLFEKKA